MKRTVKVEYDVSKEYLSPLLPPEYEDWIKFFRERTSFSPNHLQRYWGYKLSLGLSFSIVAPAGMGKSLFGLVTALYFASQGRRSYLIVPTSTLVTQFAERLRDLSREWEEILLVYKSSLKGEDKERFFSRLEKGRFRILLTTSSFLVKHFSLLTSFKFRFIFVDDIDAFLKASRNVERVLRLLNFEEEEISSGLVKKKHKRGQLIVSTATARPGKKAYLFSRLLNFGVGRLRYSVREIKDVALVLPSPEEMFEALKEILNKMGDGVLIFVPSQDVAKEISVRLGESDYPYFTSEILLSEREEIISKFKDGLVKGIVGLATPYGLLVRGLDLPTRIRYVVFFHPPLLEIEKDGTREKIGDIVSYLQASGRCSRLTQFGITKGYSFVLATDEEFEVFYRSAMIHDLEISKIDSLQNFDWERAKREVDDSRKGAKTRSLDLIKPVLLVVESPTKAKQLASFFGKPSYNVIGNQIFYETAVNDMVVITTASIGHIVDLYEDRGLYGVEVDLTDTEEVFRPIYGTIKRCEKDGFQFVSLSNCPVCGSRIKSDSGQRIKNILSVSKFVSKVFLSSDPDREGEKISNDLFNFVAQAHPDKSIYRIELHEITKKAFLNAITTTRSIRKNLVMAQVSRRVEDRWIGFSLSSILRRVFRERHLSAGRAQSPVLHWIVERTNLFQQRKKKVFLRLKGILVELEGEEIFPGSVEVEVRCLGERYDNLLPSPPFATDELLREANRLFHLGAKECMGILQELFESGLITYHRTDSHTISEYGYNLARVYLGEDFVYRVWQREPSAHECIRPTRPIEVETLQEELRSGSRVLPVKMTRLHFRLYDLIFRRFMASLAREGSLRKENYELFIKSLSITKEVELVVSAEGRCYELYPWIVKVDTPLEEGDYQGEVILKEVPLAWPFTQAELIGEMKAKGIGRPSTYAFIIDRLFMRNYIYEKKDRLYATIKGKKVDQFLFSHYRDFVSEERTRHMEKRIDDIEEGLVPVGEVFSDLYREIRMLLSQSGINP